MPIHSKDYPPTAVTATETADANPGEPRSLGSREVVFKVVITTSDQRGEAPKRIEETVQQELRHKFGDNVTVARA